jgi:hypothetical protein
LLAISERCSGVIFAMRPAALRRSGTTGPNRGITKVMPWKLVERRLLLRV